MIHLFFLLLIKNKFFYVLIKSLSKKCLRLFMITNSWLDVNSYESKFPFYSSKHFGKVGRMYFEIRILSKFLLIISCFAQLIYIDFIFLISM